MNTTTQMNSVPKTIEQSLTKWITPLSEAEKIDAINQLKKMLHELSPLKHHPVDCVLWLKTGKLHSNDYNPNSVAPPEMQLLRLSIHEDGYCVEESTPILCEDLRWRPAGSLKSGDRIIAFDENNSGSGPQGSRRFRTSVVIFNEIREDDLFEVKTDRGSVFVNAEHPWLGQRMYGDAPRRLLRWIPTKELISGDLLVHLVRPWEQDNSWESGWLAGFLDGEGSMSQNQAKNHAMGFRLSAYQRPGPTANQMIAEITKRVRASVSVHVHKNKPKWNDMTMVRVDRITEVMRLLGLVRPERLITAGGNFWEGVGTALQDTRAVVKSVRPAGPGKIASLSTSTKTYIASGFAMHNTQPIVSFEEGNDSYEVVDGFHRTRVAKECPEVSQSTLGYVPCVVINAERADKADRIASTIRHNRARGKHAVNAMSDIVIDLKARNWSNERIAKSLGMDADEILRLCQITGLTTLFQDQEFSKSWDIKDAEMDEFEGLSDQISDEEKEIHKFRTVNTGDEGRIFHTFDLWECHKAGFYKNTHPTLNREECELKYCQLLADSKKFGAALNGVITEWKHSCEHYLTNKAMNRIAWLGQAALCYAEGIPSAFRGGFNLLPDDKQKEANLVALEYLNKWLAATGREPVELGDAMPEREATIY